MECLVIIKGILYMSVNQSLILDVFHIFLKNLVIVGACIQKAFAVLKSHVRCIKSLGAAGIPNAG